jgi:hypothetical protein
MKQKLLIGLVLFLIVAAMIGLNAASYVQKEKIPDSESTPNRSSYNAGSTGTRAYFELLSETGRKVVRWQEPITNLSADDDSKPGVFVLMGPHRRPVEEHEIRDLLMWVSTGGRLIVIDRDPPKELLTTTSNWRVEFRQQNEMTIAGVDPSDKNQMTSGTNAARSVQVSTLTAGVNAIQPSRFGSAIGFVRFGDVQVRPTPDTSQDEEAFEEDYYGTPESRPTPIDFLNNAPPPPPPAKPSPTPEETYTAEPGNNIDTGTATPETAWLKAPIAHFANDTATFVTEVPYGSGRIVYLSDPFVIANGGILMADNAQLAINLVDTGGLIAFDEYHQGFGAGKNQIVEYFSGTPVVAIFLQLCAIVALVFYSRSRRFARPVPEPEPDRLSKLEYVAAMAELQRRTRAYDLALENIYSDFRRRVAKLFGVDNQLTPRREIAVRIAERTKRDANMVEAFMQKCEDIAHGEPSNNKETVRLVGEIRELENELRLSRGGRK